MRLKNIFDVSREQQTESFKREIFEDIRAFVLKYQKRYYPSYKGEVEDLIVDYYTEFTRPKKHRNGLVFSEMDRFEYEKLGGDGWTAGNEKKLAAYIQRFVINRLIDSLRKDKGEKNYAEKYNAETGELSVDYLAKLAEERDPLLEEIEVTPDMVLLARDRYDEMDDLKKKEFLKLYYKIKNDIPDNLKALFKDIVGEDTVESFKKSGQPVGPYAKEIHDILQVPVHITKIKVQGVPALKIEFDSAQDAKDMLEYKDQVMEVVSDYKNFYTKRGNCWYIKEE